MAGMIAQRTQINLPTPRTPLITIPTPNGAQLLGYPTREFLALLRQFLIRVGGPSSDTDLQTPEADISSPAISASGQDGALAVEPLMLVSLPDLQALVAQMVAQELSLQSAIQAPMAELANVDGRPSQDSPLASEMTMGTSE